MAKRKSIADFIRQCATDDDKDKPLSQIVLVHMIGASPKQLHEKKITPNLDIDGTAEMFRGKAEVYAQDLPGAQMFQLLAFFGTNEPQAFFPFSLSGLAIQEGITTEAPTPSGSLQQMMRHIETLYQVNLRTSTQLHDSQYRVIDQMAARQEQYMRESNEAREMILNIALRQATENHEHQMRELEYERQTKEREKFMALAPALANTITGKEIFPQSTGDTVILEALARHVKPEMVAGLAGMLPPQVVGMLMNRFSQIADKQAKESEAIRRIAPGDPDKELQ
jgi:hypothetical protein